MNKTKGSIIFPYIIVFTTFVPMIGVSLYYQSFDIVTIVYGLVIATILDFSIIGGYIFFRIQLTKHKVRKIRRQFKNAN